MAICHLFKYLEKHWFEEFEVRDETGYWQTGDEAELRDTMGYMDEIMNALDVELSKLSAEPDDSIIDRMGEIAKKLRAEHKPPEGLKGRHGGQEEETGDPGPT